MNSGRHKAGATGASPAANAARHAMQIAAAVDLAWHRGRGLGRPEIALGTVATLALASLTAHPEGDLEARLRQLAPDEFCTVARHVWAVMLRLRIDMVHLVCPLITWLFDAPDPQLLVHAKSAADAALEAGLVRLIGSDRRFDADLFGPLLGMLKARSATRVNAQIYTPGDLALAMVAVTVGEPEAGQAICDDAVGTGGLFRAAAQVIRARGGDPAAMEWFGADIDELAIAATVVNSLIWGLGSRVVLHVGDVLACPDWPERALRQRAEILRTADQLRDAKAVLDFLASL